MSDLRSYLHSLSKPLVVVVGPTASGKTDVGQLIALRLGGEVLSADSMQVYRGMDIGTGKILVEDRMVAHHGIDIVSPGDAFSASLYQRYGRAVVEQLDAREVPCIVCGGTGFYIRALVDDYDFPPGEQVGNEVRDRLGARVRECGALQLWEDLSAVDARSAELISPNDVKRVIRAFELLNAGTSYAEQHARLSSIRQYFPAVFFGLSVDVDVLRGRIDRRVDAMIVHGLVDEVRSLIEAGYRGALTSQQAIGYKEIVRYLDGDCSLEEAVALIKTATHRYAKRQRTWFRKDPRIRWFANDDGDAVRVADEALRTLHAEGFVDMRTRTIGA